MSDDETTFEDKIMVYALLGFLFGFGYWTRTRLSFGLFTLSVDGIVQITTLGLGILVFIGIILKKIDKRNDEK